MNTKDTLVYSQVYNILNLLGSEFTEKIPTSIYNKIIATKDDRYVKKINSLGEITPENTDKGAISMIAFFHINYWSNVEEKDKLQKILANNFEKNEAKKREKYPYEDIFKSAKVPKEQEKESQALIQVKESTFKRIVNKILEILHIKREF